MQDFRDYYESLGVTQDATADELKTAYRRAARRYHPDLNPGDETAEEKFKEIGEAYEILSDSDRRNEYDQFTQFLNDQKNPQKGLFNRAKKGTKDYSQFKDFSMFVDYLLNRRGAANTPTPSSSPAPSSPSSTPSSAAPSPTPKSPRSTSQAPSQSTDPLSVSQSSSPQSSSSPTTSANRSSTPSRSSANVSERTSSSFANRSQPPTPTPSPRNNRSSTSRTPKGNVAGTPTTGQRSAITEAQLTLPLNKAYKGGKERIRLADGRSLTVTLPQGMLSGQTVQVTAHEPNGHRLSLLIQVAPHEFFTLEMPDVHCIIPITPSEAILGGPISIPTLDGSVKMVVPAGARSGQKLRLPDKGYPFNGRRGDQIVELDIQMPTTVTARERELYEKIRLTESFRPRKNIYF